MRLTDQNLNLEKLSVLNLLSLSPDNSLISHLSWVFNTGAQRISTADGEKLVYRNFLGIGKSWK